MTDVVINEFLGLNNVTNPENIVLFKKDKTAKTFLQQASNIIINDDNKPTLRPGKTTIYEGSAHSLFAARDYCIFRASDGLYRMDKDYSVSLLRSGLNTTNIKMSCLELNDRIYLSDHEFTGVIDKGNLRSWGMEIPVNYKVQGTARGKLSGLYMLSMTFTRNDGQESGAELPIQISLPGESGIAITNIPAPEDETIDNVNIYLSSAGGEVLYFVKSVPRGTSSTTITDNPLAGSRTLSNLNSYPAIPCKFMKYSNGRIFLITENAVIYSDPFAYELFPVDNYIPIPDVVLFEPVDDGIWIATNNEMYFAAGDGPPFKFSKKADFGAVQGCIIPDVQGNVISDKLTGYYHVVFTREGISIIGNSGLLINLTDNAYKFGTYNSGACLRMTINNHEYALFSMSD
jgi:hypothetical protein